MEQISPEETKIILEEFIAENNITNLNDFFLENNMVLKEEGYLILSEALKCVYPKLKYIYSDRVKSIGCYMDYNPPKKELIEILNYFVRFVKLEAFK